MGAEVSHAAMAQFQKQGFIILEDVFSSRFVSKLRQTAEERYAKLRFSVALGDTKQASQALRYTVNSSFIYMLPEPEPLFLNERILDHPRITGAAAQILNSNDFYFPIFDVAFNLQGTKAQHPHRDFSPILPGERPLPTTTLCAAITLVDTAEENGSTCLWPGTHRLVDGGLKFEDDLSHLVKGRRHLQPKLKAGSVLLRDSRLIHCGMPNRTPTIRPWLSFVMTHPLILLPNKLKMARSTLEALPARTRKRLRYCETH